MDQTAEHIVKHGAGSGGYLVLARETDYYQCLDNQNRPACRIKHRSASAMVKCSIGVRAGAVTKAGELVAVRTRYISASNGESACLPYPLYKIETEEKSNG